MGVLTQYFNSSYFEGEVFIDQNWILADYSMWLYLPFTTPRYAFNAGEVSLPAWLTSRQYTLKKIDSGLDTHSNPAPVDLLSLLYSQLPIAINSK